MPPPRRCQSRAPLADSPGSPVKGPSACQRTRLSAAAKPGSVRKGFSVACHVRSAASTDYGGCHHHPTRLQRVSGGAGGRLVGCCTAGTGSLSGNSSTCHHGCMLVKSVRQGCLGSAGRLEAKRQQQLGRQQRAAEWDGPHRLLYKVINEASPRTGAGSVCVCVWRGGRAPSAQ